MHLKPSIEFSKAHATLSDILDRMKADFKDYKSKSDASPFYIRKQLALIQAIEIFLNVATREPQKAVEAEQAKQMKRDDATELLIKKLALLLSLSGVQYPTINQSFSCIYDAFLAKSENLDHLGELHNYKTTTVTIPII